MDLNLLEKNDVDSAMSEDAQKYKSYDNMSSSEIWHMLRMHSKRKSKFKSLTLDNLGLSEKEKKRAGLDTGCFEKILQKQRLLRIMYKSLDLNETKTKKIANSISISFPPPKLFQNELLDNIKSNASVKIVTRYPASLVHNLETTHLISTDLNDAFKKNDSKIKLIFLPNDESIWKKKKLPIIDIKNTNKIYYPNNKPEPHWKPLDESSLEDYKKFLIQTNEYLKDKKKKATCAMILNHNGIPSRDVFYDDVEGFKLLFIKCRFQTFPINGSKFNNRVLSW
ncbi:hypothetical protein A3Q56_03449 [Intoshia linei]|uniref:Uncharacterized protein n=1 Tax=Intoshia linei TaxID=1819745 RepID=A0A177B5D6_9BILA|nr:hypothetical protein A3Q56_03449 [Intoshia linei]